MNKNSSNIIMDLFIIFHFFILSANPDYLSRIICLFEWIQIDGSITIIKFHVIKYYELNRTIHLKILTLNINICIKNRRQAVTHIQTAE